MGILKWIEDKTYSFIILLHWKYSQKKRNKGYNICPKTISNLMYNAKNI